MSVAKRQQCNQSCPIAHGQGLDLSVKASPRWARQSDAAWRDLFPLSTLCVIIVVN
jgi:hypothetical protein